MPSHAPREASAPFVPRFAADLRDAEPSRTPRRVLLGRALLLSALAVAIATRGAVSYVALLATLALAAAALLLGSLASPVEPKVRRSIRLALLMAAVLAGYLLLQAWSFPGNPVANPIWNLAARWVEIPGGAISVDPGTTRNAIFLLVYPFVFYAAALALFPRDDGALRLLSWLAVLGTLFALFGLVQVTVLPRSLLFTEKTAYLDSLTGAFVNRNTAGTLLGTASLVLVALAVSLLPRNRSGGLIFAPRSGDRLFAFHGSRKVPLVAAAILIVIVALLLTRSRGALLSTAVAYVAVLPPLFLQGRGREARAGGPTGARARSPWRPVVVFALVAAAVALIVALFGGLTIRRMETRGFDEARQCLYWAALDAFGQNWRFGTGFGTFSTVYPIYRLPDCGGPMDIILRAHNFYLEGLVGLGVGFLPVLLLGTVHILGNLVHGVRHRRRLRAVPLMAMGAVLLVTLHGLVDFSLQIPGMAAYFAVFLAAATTASFGRGARSGRRAWR